MAELEQLVAEVKDATAQVQNWKAKSEQDLAAHGETLAETKAALKESQDIIDGLVTKFGSMDELVKELQAKAKRPNYGAPEGKSLGELFVESEVFQKMTSINRATSEPMEFSKKDITGSSGSAIALVDPSRDPTVYRTIGGQRQIRIRDLIPSIPTSSGAVEVMRYASFDNQAGPQQPSSPNTGQGAGELEGKNKSGLTFTLVTIPVRTIAHYFVASRQVLTDAPMLRGLIDNEMAYGLQLESDDQLLLGDGTNQNLTGILEDASINDVGEIATGTDPDDRAAAMIDHIRSAITQCQLSEYYNVNGLVLNPVDWQTLETAKATDGHYLLVAFAATSPETPSIWRVPVVVTNAMPQGQFLIGDWRLGATIYDRESVSVRVSESHGELFVKNGVVILGEERYCMGISRPKAFTTGMFSIESS